MSIYYTGTFTRSAGLISAINKQLNLMNLKPVKKIEAQFDPFHPKAVTVRDFLFHLSSKKVVATNTSCAVRTKIVCDRSDPWIKVHLGEAGSVTFLADNLTTLEIFEQFNKQISSKVVEEEVAAPLQTKSQKKRLTKRK